MNSIKIILGFYLVFTLMSCATSANYNFDKGVDFSKIKTFYWTPVVVDTEITKESIDIVKDEINDILFNKGFKVASENPDFLIAASLTKKKKLQASDVGCRLTPQQIERVSYNEGSLILTFLDGKTKAKIWWGEARANLGKNIPPKKMERRVKEAIQKLLKDFPPDIE